MTKNKPVAIIGYSGHGLVAADIFLCAGRKVLAYCDEEEKKHNPFSLQYLGNEKNAGTITLLKRYEYFISVGDNKIREKIYKQLSKQLGKSLNAIHPSAIISPSAKLADGIFVAANATINPFAQIGIGAICNTACSIDHECVVEDFVHIAPGAILCGNVKIGEKTFIGAGAVIRQGIIIGKNVMIGAGCVVIKNIPDNVTIVGNPQKEIRK